MTFNVLEDLLMPGAIIVLVTSVTLMGFRMSMNHSFELIKKKSPLHREVITQYRDDCLQRDQNRILEFEKTLDQCSEEATELAISKGYADKLPGIFKDAAFHLTDDQMARLKAATPST